jgi:hypothetical protein
LKLEIQKIFTKIRSALNEREDYLILEVVNQYENIFFNEDIIKESDKLPNKIQESLKASKINEEDWNDNKLKNCINDCVTIEKNIEYIKKINENIKKCSSTKDLEILFTPNKDEEINKFIENIKNFGKLYKNEKNERFSHQII